MSSYLVRVRPLYLVYFPGVEMWRNRMPHPNPPAPNPRARHHSRKSSNQHHNCTNPRGPNRHYSKQRSLRSANLHLCPSRSSTYNSRFSNSSTLSTLRRREHHRYHRRSSSNLPICNIRLVLVYRRWRRRTRYTNSSSCSINSSHNNNFRRRWRPHARQVCRVHWRISLRALMEPSRKVRALSFMRRPDCGQIPI